MEWNVFIFIRIVDDKECYIIDIDIDFDIDFDIDIVVAAVAKYFIPVVKIKNTIIYKRRTIKNPCHARTVPGDKK